jgi:hypothetical protein
MKKFCFTNKTLYRNNARANDVVREKKRDGKKSKFQNRKAKMDSRGLGM